MKPTALNACNPELSCIDSVYREPNRSSVESDLSSYLNIAVPKLINANINSGLFSPELEAQLDTPELRYEFGHGPYNVLRACDFTQLPSRQHALDLTQDFGGTAHFISEVFEQVDSIISDLGRAKLAHQRHANSDNIHTVSLNLEQLCLPDQHYGLIFIGKLEDLNLDKIKTKELLIKLNNALSENGVLLVSLKNPHRLSKWLNIEPHEADNEGLHADLYAPEHQTLFNLSEITQALHDSGFASPNTNASFSSHQSVPNLLSLDYLDNSNSALNHFYRIGSVAASNVNEYAMYKALKEQGEALSSMASRYVVFAGKTAASAKQLYDRDFTHFPGSRRQPFWRAITYKRSDEDMVRKQIAIPTSSLVDVSNGTLLKQNLEPQPFHDGPLLIDAWITAILNNDNATFTQLLTTYHDWLNELANSKLAKNEDNFSSYAYDLTPFNIVSAAACLDGTDNQNTESNTSPSKDHYRIIDPEWQITEPISPDFVFFRALLWFAFENRGILHKYCDHWGFQNIDSLVRHYLNLVSSDREIDGFIRLEEQVQLEISSTFNAHSVSMALQQSFSSEIVEQKHRTPTACVTWADKDNNFDQANAIYLNWHANSETQLVSGEFRQFDSNKSILRVDPIDNTGLFHFDSVSLHDAADKVVWKASTTNEIANSAELCNVEISNEGQTVSDSSSMSFIALNSDPFLLFDLTDHPNLSAVRQIKLSLRLTYDPNYQQAFEKLIKLVDEQSASIVKLGNKAHETRADIDALEAKLQHTENERHHLALRAAEMDRVMSHNKELEQALMQTRSQRIKRLIKRVLGQS